MKTVIRINENELKNIIMEYMFEDRMMQLDFDDPVIPNNYSADSDSPCVLNLRTNHPEKLVEMFAEEITGLDADTANYIAKTLYSTGGIQARRCMGKIVDRKKKKKTV